MITRKAITAQVMFTVSVASFGDLELFNAFLDDKRIHCMLVSIPLNLADPPAMLASQHHVSIKFLFHFQ
jgi:hypothetical protein